MIGLLICLYPTRWRDRYGEEFRVVLEARPLGPFDVADVLIGALDARLTPFRLPGSAGHQGGHNMMLRIGGFGAIAGGALWFAGLAVSSAIPGDRMWLGLLAVGTLGLLVALVGLSAFQAQRDPALAWAAFAIPGIGTIVSILGLTGMDFSTGDDALILGSLSAWTLWIVGLLATVIGSILFGVTTIRAAVLSRRAAQALTISSLVMLLIAASSLNTASTTGLSTLLIAGVVGSFALSWIALGMSALRGGPIRAVVAA
jgi:hypothetical protein